MRVFKCKTFSAWAKAKNIIDEALKSAAEELQLGLFEANLGGGLYKKRVARKHNGKSSGYRILIAYKRADKIIFLYGFAKNIRTNINVKEKDIYKMLAKYYLSASDAELTKLIKLDELFEVLL